MWNTNKLKLKIPTEKCLEPLDHVEETGDTSKFFEHIDYKDALLCAMCGSNAEVFRNKTSRLEYQICMCQTCQDDVFYNPNNTRFKRGISMTIDKPLTRKAVRKPRALPPNLTSIIKLSKGGSTNDDNVIPFVNLMRNLGTELKRERLIRRERGKRYQDGRSTFR